MRSPVRCGSRHWVTLQEPPTSGPGAEGECLVGCASVTDRDMSPAAGRGHLATCQAHSCSWTRRPRSVLTGWVNPPVSHRGPAGLLPRMVGIAAVGHPLLTFVTKNTPFAG